MQEVSFVNAKSLKTLEHYAAALLSGMISLGTLELFHQQALKKGILDEDEQETAKTICWELQRLLALYRTQINHVLERTELDEKTVLNSLIEILKQPKTKKKKEKEDV
jgi:hypothetical protein